VIILVIEKKNREKRELSPVYNKKCYIYIHITNKKVFCQEVLWVLAASLKKFGLLFQEVLRKFKIYTDDLLI